MIDFRPRCLATANQGMCHTDAARASQIILENLPEIPILPNLSNLGYMKGALRYTEGMPCLTIDEEKGRVYFDTSRNFEEELSRFYESYLAQDLDALATTPKCDPGFHYMLEVVKKRRPAELKTIKFGINGPITFTMRNVDENNKPIFYNEALREAIIKSLVMKVKWQEKKIKEVFPGVPTMVQIGEPLMGMYGSAFVSLRREEVLAALKEVVAATDGLSYIHCCANTDWPLLMETGASAISFDAYEYADRVALYPQEIKSYLEKGGVLAWGIVPTTDDKIARETPEALLEKLEASMELMVRRGVDKRLLVEKALVTPSCGTGAMTVPPAEKVYRYTNLVATTMRRRYFAQAG